MDKPKCRQRNPGNAGRCAKQRSKQTYSRKRKGHNKLPKQNVVVERVEEEVAEEIVEVLMQDVGIIEEYNTSASFDKVEEIATEGVNNITGNRIMDMTILNSVVSCLACPECFAIDKLILEDLCTKKKDLASYLCIKCGACGYSRHFYSSKMIEADGCGMKSFDINTRVVYGMRAVGGGYNSLKKLCGHLNMPKPMTEKSHKNISKRIRESTKFVAEASMKSAASELANKNGGVSDVSVSVDGTWQKRGFSS